MLSVAVADYRGPEGRGFLLASGREVLRAAHAWPTWVAGVGHHLDDVSDASFEPGNGLALLPEPNNVHDPKAVGVWNLSRTKHAGYIGRVFSEDMSSLDCHGVILMDHMTDGVRDGLLVLVSRGEFVLKNVELGVDEVVTCLRRLPDRPSPPPQTIDPVEQMWRMSRLDET
jgi:hypothetical protein